MRKTANNEIHLNLRKCLSIRYLRQLAYSKAFLERDGFDFPQWFQLVDNQSNYGEIKPWRRWVEMEGHWSSAFGMKTALEFIYVNLYVRY